MSTTASAVFKKTGEQSAPAHTAVDDGSSADIDMDADDAASLTYKHQSSLPKLPIPPLEETCARYLDYIRALQTPAEYDRSVQCVREFLQRDGPVLQQKLIEYEKDKHSYVEDFWYESYLNIRSSVTLNVNPFFVLEDDPTPTRNNQLSRAASLAPGPGA